ncbi:MAG TPA: HmuY family protein [Chitinophagaceae bacterium]|nr:HmuY family protein [Chitinophagaceae bacterium]
MKKSFLTFLSVMALSAPAFSQWMVDSVQMGTNSANDVFYSLNTGTVKTEDNKNWHLAFSMAPSDSAAIWANHNTGNGYVKVYNIHKSLADWSTVTLADTNGAHECFNRDKGWFQGALNDLPRASVFDFGWGTYDMASHNLYGDSLFIIKANNIFYKVAIDSLQSLAATYYFRVEDLSTPGTTFTDTVMKGTQYANRNFAYYNLATAADTNREPANTDWDLVFNRYNSLVDMGGGPVPYSVIGALSNKGVKVSKAAATHVDTAFKYYGTYVMPWPNDSLSISGVGYEWKSYTPPMGPWVVPDSISYFVNDKSGNLYQLQFTGYSGSGSGKIYLRKRMVVPTAVNDIHSVISSYEFFPNPARDVVYFTVQSKENKSGTMRLYNSFGQCLYTTSLSLNQGQNSYSIPVQGLNSGLYFVQLEGEGMNIQHTLSVLK